MAFVVNFKWIHLTVSFTCLLLPIPVSTFPTVLYLKPMVCTMDYQNPWLQLYIWRCEVWSEVGLDHVIRLNQTVLTLWPPGPPRNAHFKDWNRGKPSRIVWYVYYSLTHVSQTSQISQFALKLVTDVTDLTDLTDLTQLTVLTVLTKKGWI